MEEINFKRSIYSARSGCYFIFFILILLILWFQQYMLLSLIIIAITLMIVLNFVQMMIMFDFLHHHVVYYINFLDHKLKLSGFNYSDFWDYDFVAQRGFSYRDRTGEGVGRFIFDHLYLRLFFIKSPPSRKVKKINLSIKRNENVKLFQVLSSISNFYMNPFIEEKITELRLNIDEFEDNFTKTFSFQTSSSSKNHRVRINEKSFFLYLLLRKKSTVPDAKKISLKGLGLKQIPDLRHVIDLNEVEELDLSWNNFSGIVNIDCYPNLKILNLSHNQITRIENLTALTKLEILYLNANHIKEIENLEENRSLRFLYLGDNQIESLHNINYLDKLEYLYLDRNRLTAIKCDDLPAGLVVLNLRFNDASIINRDCLKKLNEIILDKARNPEHRLYGTP